VQRSTHVGISTMLTILHFRTTFKSADQRPIQFQFQFQFQFHSNYFKCGTEQSGDCLLDRVPHAFASEMVFSFSNDQFTPVIVKIKIKIKINQARIVNHETTSFLWSTQLMFLLLTLR